MARLEPRRAALYVDFDNVFTAFASFDRARALAFATEPGRWLHWLAEGRDGDGCRRLLVRRCYLNPAGNTAPASGGAPVKGDASQVPFSQFRGAFIRDGFEVVDCPRLARLKNAADIAMALDIADALAHPTRFDEFLILSGDADFTPVLHRLRAHDRRSTVLAPTGAAEAFEAAADRVLRLDALAEGFLTPKQEAPARGWAMPPAAETSAPLELSLASSPLVPDPGGAAEQRAALLALVQRHLEDSSGPVRLAAIGKALYVACMPWVKTGAYGGAGTLTDLVRGGEGWVLAPDPAGGWLYHATRHQPPSPHEG